MRMCASLFSFALFFFSFARIIMTGCLRQDEDFNENPFDKNQSRDEKACH